MTPTPATPAPHHEHACATCIAVIDCANVDCVPEDYRLCVGCDDEERS